MTFANAFMVGADPELVMLDPPRLLNAQTALQRTEIDAFVNYGFDHGGYVLEPHPTPNRSVRKVCQSIHSILDYLHYKSPNSFFRAGAYLQFPARNIGLGGHVHLDLKKLSKEQIDAMNNFTEGLEGLDILPTLEAKERRNNSGYGQPSDIRSEHGHVEYRSMCSWLYSPKVTMLAMTGVKLAAVNPDSFNNAKGFDSHSKLRKIFEGFKGKDNDVDWMFDRGYFSVSGVKSLKSDPASSVMTAWKACQARGKGIATILAERHLSRVKSRVSDPWIAQAEAQHRATAAFLGR